MSAEEAGSRADEDRSRADVEQANAVFYAAIEQADVEAMSRVWDDQRPADVSCVHPGWPPVHGRRSVLHSWAAILAGTESLQFLLTDVRVAVEGDIAVVTCTENVLTAGDAGAAAATNVFRRRPDGWRLQVHHAGPLPTQDDDGA